MRVFKLNEWYRPRKDPKYSTFEGYCEELGFSPESRSFKMIFDCLKFRVLGASSGGMVAEIELMSKSGALQKIQYGYGDASDFYPLLAMNEADHFVKCRERKPKCAAEATAASIVANMQQQEYNDKLVDQINQMIRHLDGGSLKVSINNETVTIVSVRQLGAVLRNRLERKRDDIRKEADQKKELADQLDKVLSDI